MRQDPRGCSCPLNEQGSFTVEAALVFTVLVLACAFLMSAFLILYQQALLNGTAAAAAREIAALRSAGQGLYGELFTGTEEIGLDLNGGENEKPGQSFLEQCVQAAARARLAGSVVKPVRTDASVRIKRGLLTGNVQVVVVQEINVPGGQILCFFGGRKTLLLSGKGTASIARPAQYIRNIDLLLEYAESIKEKK